MNQTSVTVLLRSYYKLIPSNTNNMYITKTKSLKGFLSFLVYLHVNATNGEELVRLFAMVGSNAVAPTPLNQSIGT